MAETVMKPDERYIGSWNGQMVCINRMFRGKLLTEEQCSDLCDGKTIEVTGLISQKTGKEYGITVKLCELTNKAKGHKYIGIDQVDFIKQRRVPNVLCRHIFTDEEKMMLEAGMRIHVNDFYSEKNGYTFECDCSYDKDTGKIDFYFDR